MKTEFNVERVCERVQMCVVEAPEELGQPLIEVRKGSIYVSFPNLDAVTTNPGDPADVQTLRMGPDPGPASGDAVPGHDPTAADGPAPANPGRRGGRRGK